MEAGGQARLRQADAELHGGWRVGAVAAGGRTRGLHPASGALLRQSGARQRREGRRASQGSASRSGRASRSGVEDDGRKKNSKNMLLCGLCCGIYSARSIFNPQIVDTG
jgi:hypothetical protein